MSTDHPPHQSRTKRSYLKETVLEAAKNRIRWLYTEFPTIIVNTSGGKDSTTALHLTLQIAEELNRLPLPALFIDQEAEWAATINTIRNLMRDPRIEPHWLQTPLDLRNASSPRHPTFTAWDPHANQWMRPKEPNSIHHHPTNTRDYRLAFNHYVQATWPNQPTAQISGTRAEESMARMYGLTTHPVHKGETWGGRWSKRGPRITFYPLYDWSTADVWKAIHEHAWPYNPLYDAQYQRGIPTNRMRAGSMLNETSATHLEYLQEVEPQTFDALTRRQAGLATAAQITDTYTTPKEPPPMFRDWRDYRDHLLQHLITNEADRTWFAQTFARHEGMYNEAAQRDLHRTQVAMILTNDTTGAKLNGFLSRRANARTTRTPRP